MASRTPIPKRARLAATVNADGLSFSLYVDTLHIHGVKAICRTEEPGMTDTRAYVSAKSRKQLVSEFRELRERAVFWDEALVAAAEKDSCNAER